MTTSFLMPIANYYAESWIGSLKRECLNHLICFSLSYLDHVTQTYATLSSPEQVEEACATTTRPALSDDERARMNAILLPRFGMV